MAWLGLAGIGWDWLALVGAPPPLTPEKTALHTKSAQTAGLEAIWCEALRKILRNPPFSGSVEPERPQQHPL
ncbi:hypothetical protein [Corynebacterium diphtheriae]|uniref:hypothetical protein n=1 Tax=Corynebacterium diphtheriae TaxID=1717 RepID=UPI0009B6296A